MFKTLREELQCRNLKLDYKEPSYLVNCQWRNVHPYIFLIYRVFLAAYCVVWLTVTVIKDALVEGQGSRMLLFMTTWVLLVATLYTMTSVLCTTYHHIIRRRRLMKRTHQPLAEPIDRDVDFPMSISSEPITLNTDNVETQVSVITDVRIITPWYMQVSWFLYDVTTTSSLLLALLYWPLFHQEPITDTKINNNIIIPVMFLMDAFMNKTPVRVLHVFYPLLFFMVYAMFHILYCTIVLKNKNPIYNLIDWYHKPLLPGMCLTIVIFLLLPLCHCFYFMLYRLRLHIRNKYSC